MHRVRQVQNSINDLLFDGIGGDRKKLLTIIVKRDKHGKFDFLKAETEWEGVGTWRKFKHEKDAVIEVEFKDKDSFKTKRLMPLLEKYNELVVGEKKLYARVTPVDVSSL